MHSTVETITPEKAAEYLAANTNNYRKPSASTVDRYALDMAHGNWRLTGEAIKFDTNEDLADGQQRLLACVKADAPFETLVIRDVDPDAAETMDFGRKRSFDSFLRRHGEVNTMRLASAINMSWRWETDRLLSGETPSPIEAMTWFRRNPDIRESLKMASAAIDNLGLAPSAATSFTYRAQQLDPEMEVAFRHALVSGTSLEERHPILALRRLFLTGNSNPDAVMTLALLIKTWNACLAGRSVSYVVWRREGVNREAFPAMMTPRRAEAATA